MKRTETNARGIMQTASHDPVNLIIGKLSRLVELGADDQAAIAGLSFEVAAVGANEYLVREGDIPTRCCVLLSGYACRHKTSRTGARQIVSFHLPGDILDLQHLQLPYADHNVQIITAGEVAWMPANQLSQLTADYPNINSALWRDVLIDGSIYREWILNVGRRDARSRIAHMLCEFAARRAVAGLGSAEHFELPMTQEQIADATGLTPVHVNRMLQALRDEGVLSREGRMIQIVDDARMRRIADFEPAYLHQAA